MMRWEDVRGAALHAQRMIFVVALKSVGTGCQIVPGCRIVLKKWLAGERLPYR